MKASDNKTRDGRVGTNTTNKTMKFIKLFLAVAAATVICCNGAFAGCGDKASCDKKDQKEHKCCAEAKAAGKTCDTHTPKEETKKQALIRRDARLG